MPTRIPGTGAMLTSATEWETLLAQLEAIRAVIAQDQAAGTARDTATGQLTTSVQKLTTRVRSLENIVSLPSCRIEDQPARPGLLAAVEALAARLERLEATTGQGAGAVEDLAALVEARVPVHLGRQVGDIHLAVHRPGERPRTVGGGVRPPSPGPSPRCGRRRSRTRSSTRKGEAAVSARLNHMHRPGHRLEAETEETLPWYAYPSPET